MQNVVVVTGAGQGIGKAIAARFVQNGASVVIAEKNEKTGKKAALDLQAEGSASYIKADVSSETSVRALIRQVKQRFGRLDALINNAAAFNFKKLESVTLADWNEVISTNLTGTFLCSKYAAPLLKRSKGSIVNIASTRALQSEPGKEAYAASKGGIVSLTHALAMSLGPHVRVNSVCPDWIDVGKEAITEENEKLFPLERVGEPRDVAGLVYFLCSPEAGFITASNVVIDGGLTRKMSYE